MKIWKAYAGEHSSSFKIVGSFQNVSDAAAAATLFNRLLDAGQDSGGAASPSLAQAVLEVCRGNSLADFSSSDAAQLCWFEPVMAAGTEIRVETNGTEMQALLKVMLRFGANVEIYSRSPCAK